MTELGVGCSDWFGMAFTKLPMASKASLSVLPSSVANQKTTLLFNVKAAPVDAPTIESVGLISLRFASTDGPLFSPTIAPPNDDHRPSTVKLGALSDFARRSILFTRTSKLRHDRRLARRSYKARAS